MPPAAASATGRVGPPTGKTVSVTPNHARPGQRHAEANASTVDMRYRGLVPPAGPTLGSGGDPLPTLPTMDLLFEPPTVDEYVRLRREAGLTVRTKEQARPALKNSWLWVTVRIDGQAVAMGRVIGDGGWYFHIADMATLPAHQHKGIGRTVLDALLQRIHAEAPAEPWITLFADPAGVALYRAAGFVPNGCQGMELPPRSE